jgi:predicted kinase
MGAVEEEMLEQHSAPRNLFIQMSGAPGSGKSTMATLLQQSIGGLVIDHDLIKSSLLEDSEANFDQTTKRAYRLQWVWAEEVIKQGHNVIIEST